MISSVIFASAQPVSVGALGGVRPTDVFSYGDESKPYAVGGSVEIHLPAQFAIEADALYERIDQLSSLINIGQSSSLIGLSTATSIFVSRERGNSWQFPLYMKYYFRPQAAWKPFVGSGFAFRTVSFHNDVINFNNPDAVMNGKFHFDYRSPLAVGASIVAGLRYHAGPVAFLPQVRYTRWSNTSDQINGNEVTLLLGVTF